MMLARWFERLFQRSGRHGLRAGSTSFYSASRSMQDEARAAARRDAESGRPGATDPSLAHYEQSVIELSRQVIDNHASDMRHNDALLVPEFLETRRDFQSAQRAYEEQRRALGGRPLRVEIPGWFYVPMVLVLMAGEVGVNFAAFETVFLENRRLTGVAAGVLGIVLLLAAHLIGVAVRQHKQYGFAAIAGSFAVFVTVGLAYLRNIYIATQNAEVMVFGGVKLDEMAITAFFFVFNMLFLAAATWMAAVRHDPDADYERLHRDYRRTRNRALACKRARDANREHFLADARDWVGVCRRLLALYRDENIALRQAKVTPQVWHQQTLDVAIALDEASFELALSTDIGLLQDDAELARASTAPTLATAATQPGERA